MIQNNQSESNKITLIGFLMILFVSWMISGFLGAIPALRSAFISMLAFLIIICSVLQTQGMLDSLIIKNKVWILFLSWFFFAGFEYILKMSYQTTIALLFPFVFVCYSVYAEQYGLPGKNIALVSFCVDILFKIAVTSFYLRTNELIIKQADHIGYASANGITRTVIGYSAIYLMPSFIILIIAKIKDVSKKKKYILFFVCICCIGIVYFSQISMIVFAVAVLLAALILFRLFPKKTNILSIVLILVCIFYIFRYPILENMQSWSFLGATVRNRITGLLNVMQNDMDYVYESYSGSMVKGDSVVNRFYSYSESLKAFFHNFFLGKLLPDAYEGAGHSMLLDMVGTYGIFPVLPLLILIFKRYKYLIKKYADYKTYIDLIMLYFLAVSCLNNISLSIVFMFLYYLIPTFLDNKNQIKPE